MEVKAKRRDFIKSATVAASFLPSFSILGDDRSRLSEDKRPIGPDDETINVAMKVAFFPHLLRAFQVSACEPFAISGASSVSRRAHSSAATAWMSKPMKTIAICSIRRIRTLTR